MKVTDINIEILKSKHFSFRECSKGLENGLNLVHKSLKCNKLSELTYRFVKVNRRFAIDQLGYQYTNFITNKILKNYLTPQSKRPLSLYGHSGIFDGYSGGIPLSELGKYFRRGDSFFRNCGD